MIQTLEFFDNNGNNLNFELNNDVWFGIASIPTSSVGLHEVMNIFIYDKLHINGNLVYAHFQPTDNLGYKFRFRFKNKNEIKLYTYNREQEQVLYPESLETPVNQEFCTLENEIKVATTIRHNPIKIPITLIASKEDEFENTLIVELINLSADTITKIAEIKVIGESEGEDERFKSLLQNLDLNPVGEEVKVFADSDPIESGTDWRILNKKKKEALLENKSLKNYKFSYKGLLNAIAYYGYTLGIKEYWKNVNKTSKNYGKYSLIKVIDELTSEVSESYIKEEFNKPNKVYRKTKFISLVYAINRIVKNKFDEQNLPITEEVSKFSIEETLVKLYSLKKILSKKYLPLDVKIVDVIAEGDYFGTMNMSVNTLNHTISEVELGLDIDIDVNPGKIGYITDLRKTLFDLKGIKEAISLRNKVLKEYPDQELKDFEDDDKFDLFKVMQWIRTGEINDMLNSNFEKFKETFAFYFITPNTNISLYDSNENVPCGHFTELKINSFKDYTIDELRTTSLNEFEPHVTLDNLRFRENYEIEWIVEYNGPTYKYKYQTIGKPKEKESIKLILPYIGKYSVYVNVYNLNSHKTNKIYTDLIEVKGYNSDFIGVYRSYFKDVKLNDLSHKTINQVSQTIDTPYVSQVKLKDLQLTFDALRQENYANENRYNSLDNYTFENMPNARLNQLKHLTIDSTRYTRMAKWVKLKDLPYRIDKFGSYTLNDLSLGKVKSDIPTSFVIFALSNIEDDVEKNAQYIEQIGNNIRITNKLGSKELNYGKVGNTVADVEQFVEVCDRTFPNYEFNILWKYTEDGKRKGLDRIVVTGKYVSDVLDCTVEYWTSVIEDQKYNNKNLVGITSGVSYTLGTKMNNIEIVSDRKDIKQYTQITFNTNKSRVPGRRKHRWIVKNEDSGTSYTLESDYLTYLFKEKGEHSITVEYMDSNLNKYSYTKPGVINVI